MSVFRCSRCDKYKDSDFIGCEEDPKSTGELMCPAHAEDDEEELPEWKPKYSVQEP